MTIYTATIYRTDTNKKLETANTNKVGKMHMFRMMQDAGSTIVDLFDDCGEFEFIWNKKTKVWEFFSEESEKVGYAKFERDYSAEHKKALKQYEENKSAYKAS